MILLSAGHHPGDKGAVKFDDNSFNEYDEARKWVVALGGELSLLGLRYHSVPTGALSSKIKYINNFDEPVLMALEIHFNSAANYRAVGSETLYCPGSVKGKEYATKIQDAMAKVFKPSRGVKEGWYRQDKPGHVDYAGDVEGDEKKDAFLSQTKPVSLILEPEFIHNRGIIVANRDRVCKLIAGAINEISQSP